MRPITAVINDNRPLPLLSGELGNWQGTEYAPGVQGNLRCRGSFVLLGPCLLMGHRCLVLTDDQGVPAIVNRCAMVRDARGDVTGWSYEIESDGAPRPLDQCVFAARPPLEIARDTAARLVHAGPEATGFAAPTCHWVYLGDYAINNLRYTEQEAERWAARLRPAIEAAVLEAILEVRHGTHKSVREA